VVVLVNDAYVILVNFTYIDHTHALIFYGFNNPN